MTDRTNWEGVQDDRTQRAAACLEGYLLTDWAGCMDCEGVEDCIETNEGVQDAIVDLINQHTDFPVNYPPMQMLPSGRLTQDLSTAYNPECNKDILFGQCYGVVDLIDASISDVMQKLETATNVGELVTATISTIPILAGLVKVIGLDGAGDMLDYFQEVAAEGYDAQYTTTPGGTRDQIACAIFCACKDDCTITIQRIIDVLAARLAVYQSPPSLSGFIDLVETLAGINVDTTYVVDSAFYAAVGLMATGNYLFGGVADNVIDLVIKLSADEPSNDWQLLCNDCDEIEYRLFTAQIVFGGTEYDSGVFESGVPFEVVAQDDIVPGLYHVCVYFQGTYTMEYTIDPVDPTHPNNGGVVWQYMDLTNDEVFEYSPPDGANDMPNNIDVKGQFDTDWGCLTWVASEPFTIELTLTTL